MTLASVIQRSKVEREAWRYTSLAEVERVLGDRLTESCESQPLPSRSPPLPNPPPRGGREFCLACGTDAHNAGRPRLVFLNGVWQRELSYLNGLPQNILQGDPVSGYRLVLAEQTCLVLSPLELVFAQEGCDAPTEATTTLSISLGASARLTLIERHVAGDVGAATEGRATVSDKNVFAHVMETSIELDEQAKLVHGKIVHGDDGLVHLARTNVEAAAGAYYDGFVLLAGGKLLRHEADIALEGRLAQSRLHGAMLLRGSEHADITTRVRHNAMHCTSRQLVKSVLDGKARGVFQGKITVAEGAQKADGYQLSRALLLSEQAEMDAKPELEIYADDVKCSHGAAVGDLDEDMMFYLRSRGMDEATARALLIEGFIGELVEDIQAPELREVVQQQIKRWING